MNDFFSTSFKIVKEAAEKAKKIFGHSIIERLKENDDLATNADLEIEEFIFNSIKNKFPTHGFDSEEREIYQPEAEYMWILDPIDGTKYFHQGIPLYSIALALRYKKELVIGIVCIPQTNEIFFTSTYNKKGAKRNDLPIFCSNKKPIDDLSVIMELPNRNNSKSNLDYALSIEFALIEKVKRIRIIGVGALSLCYCAMGGFDVYLNLSMTRKHYDSVAGKIILQQAGGYFIENNYMIAAGRENNVKSIIDFLQQKKIYNMKQGGNLIDIFEFK